MGAGTSDGQGARSTPSDIQREGDPLRRSLRLTAKPRTDHREVPEPPKFTLLWDEWTQLCFDDALDRMAMEADSLGLPPKPLSERLRSLRAEAARSVSQSRSLR